MTPVEVHLSGWGEIHREPERAVVPISITFSGQDRAAASEKVQATAQEIQANIRSLAERDADGNPTAQTAIMRWSSSGMTTTSRLEEYFVEEDVELGSSTFNNAANAGTLFDNTKSLSSGNATANITTNTGNLFGNTKSPFPSNANANNSNYGKVLKSRYRRVYEARIQIEARFRDFSKLSTFTLDLSVMPLVSVGSINWVLTPETNDALLAESTKKAYANALAKASAYADAMGLKIVKPVKIEESRSNHFSGGSGLFGASNYAVQAPPVSRAAQEPAFSCVPQDVAYNTKCDVKFRIE